MEYKIEIKPVKKSSKKASKIATAILSGEVIVSDNKTEETKEDNRPSLNIVMSMDKNRINYSTESGRHIRTIHKAEKVEKGKGIYRWDNMDTNVPDCSNNLAFAIKKCQESIKKFFGKWDINVVFN